MILIDTSVWIDHARVREPALVEGLRSHDVAIHEFVIGELALGAIPDRSATLKFLLDIPRVPTLPTGDVLLLVDRFQLFGVGIGYVDAHLLGAANSVMGVLLWTRDRRLAAAAHRMGILSDLK